MKTLNSKRREFLFQLGGVAGTAWIRAQWPSIVAAAQHAYQAVQSKQTTKFEVFTPEQAREVQAIAARILPTDELPGATEAGVVYFIDHALKTFASSTRPIYEEGLAHAKEMTAEMFPDVEQFSLATPEQQDKILAALEAEAQPSNGTRRNAVTVAPSFFQTIRVHTIFGFLVDPEGGGNRDYVGWKIIERDPAHSFAPPFGFYDKDYPGWQPAGTETQKK
jgi:gluconate 2-dehydrogenase gamma chain